MATIAVPKIAPSLTHSLFTIWTVLHRALHKAAVREAAEWMYTILKTYTIYIYTIRRTLKTYTILNTYTILTCHVLINMNVANYIINWKNRNTEILKYYNFLKYTPNKYLLALEASNEHFLNLHSGTSQWHYGWSGSLVVIILNVWSVLLY